MKYNIPNIIKDTYPKPLISGLMQLFADNNITPLQYNARSFDDRVYIAQKYIDKLLNSEHFTKFMEYASIKFGRNIQNDFKNVLNIEISDEEISNFEYKLKDLFLKHSPEVIKAFWYGLLDFLGLND